MTQTNRPPIFPGRFSLVSDAFGMLPTGEINTVLDAPCGMGRVSLWLARKGYDVTAIDLGEAAVKMTKKELTMADLSASVGCQDIFNTLLEEQFFDATICFRFLHHFGDSETQDRLISELCRVTQKYVVISYLSPYSVTSLCRQIKNKLGRKAITQFPTSLRQLESMFRQAGFGAYGTVRRSGVIHSLQLAIFHRT